MSAISLSVKNDLIKRETDKAILIEYEESENQEFLFEGTEKTTKQVWIPKSLLNSDWKIINRITIPDWFYRENF